MFCFLDSVSENRFWVPIVVSVLLGFICVGSLLAEGIRIQHEYEAGETWVEIQDVNGDRRADLLIQKDRTVFAYHQVEQLGFDLAGTGHRSQVQFPHDIFLFDVFTGNSGTESVLYGVGPDGVRAFRFSDGGDQTTDEGKQIVSHNTVFSGKNARSPKRISFLRDLNGSGQVDLFLPVEKGYRMFLQNEGSFQDAGLLQFRPDSVSRFSSKYLNGSLSSKVRFPELFSGSIIEEDTSQIAYFQERFLGVHSLQSSERDHRSQPGVREVFTRHIEQISKRKNNLVQHRIPPLFDDIEGGELQDLLISDAGDGVLYVFLGEELQEKAKRYEQPDQVLKPGGWIVNRELRDLNGNQRKDLIVLTMDEVGVWGALELIATYTIPLEIQVYRNLKQGIFSSSPVFRRRFRANVQLRSEWEEINVETPFEYAIESETPSEKKTFSKLVVRAAPDQMVIHNGTKNGFTEDPTRKLNTRSTAGYGKTELIFRNITGGSSDIVLLSQDPYKERNLLQLFLFPNSDSK